MKLQFKNNGKSIKYRITNGRRGLDLTKTIPNKLNPSDIWNNKSQLTNNNLHLNKELLTFKAYLIDSVSNAVVSKKNISKELINKLHIQYFNPIEEVKKYEPTLLQYAKIFETNYALSESGLKRLGTLKSKLKQLPQIKIKEADIIWISNFSKVLLKQKYAESSINKHLQLIRQIIRYADINELEIRRNILSFHLLKTSTITHYLNENELELVFNFKTLNKSLENTRQLFLIGCTTGLRISDLMKIKSFHISNEMIELTTTKTSQNIVIPINPRVKEFVSKVKPLAHPTFNRNLKELFKAIGLDEIVKGYVNGKNNKRVDYLVNL